MNNKLTIAALGLLSLTLLGAYHLATSAAEYAHRITTLSTALCVSTGQMRAWTRAAAEAGVEELETKWLERIAVEAGGDSCDLTLKRLNRELAAAMGVPDFKLPQLAAEWKHNDAEATAAARARHVLIMQAAGR